MLETWGGVSCFDARIGLVRQRLVVLLLVSGCANLSAPRHWGQCAVLGALVGGAAGTGVGMLINDQGLGHKNSNTCSARSAAPAVGAIVGGAAGHFICDPLITATTSSAAATSTAATSTAAAASGQAEDCAPRRKFRLQQVEDPAGDAAVLDEAATTLKANPNVTINVDGYCDAVGSEKYNLKLSDRRSNAVVNYLVKAGIPSSQLIPHGYGKTDFVATNKTAEGRAQNRRVELVPNQ